jgi:hypothetical protein
VHIEKTCTVLCKNSAYAKARFGEKFGENTKVYE